LSEKKRPGGAQIEAQKLGRSILKPGNLVKPQKTLEKMGPGEQLGGRNDKVGLKKKRAKEIGTMSTLLPPIGLLDAAL